MTPYSSTFSPVISLHVYKAPLEREQHLQCNVPKDQKKKIPDLEFTDHERLADQSYSLIIRHGDNCHRKTKPTNAWFPYLSQVFYNIRQSFCAFLHPDRAG